MLVIARFYLQSFNRTLHKYTEIDKGYTINYNANKLTDNLVSQEIDDLIKNVLKNPFENQRIRAVEKLGDWGSKSSALQILNRIYKSDPNLEMREAAYKALTKIRSRMFQT